MLSGNGIRDAAICKIGETHPFPPLFTSVPGYNHYYSGHYHTRSFPSPAPNFTNTPPRPPPPCPVRHQDHNHVMLASKDFCYFSCFLFGCSVVHPPIPNNDVSMFLVGVRGVRTGQKYNKFEIPGSVHPRPQRIRRARRDRGLRQGERNKVLNNRNNKFGKT